LPGGSVLANRRENAFQAAYCLRQPEKRFARFE
jgi:hypothetical protein